MGKSWKKASITANNQKKGKMFTKLAREIQVASKMGGPDPDANARLKLAIVAARSQSCPKDTIERAINKGAGIGDDEQIFELTYEGYGPHGVGIIVECLTDNKNRTAADIRSIFTKNGGNMGESGSVSWMFERVCLVEGKNTKAEDPEEEAIEAGANEVEKNQDEGYSFYGPFTDLEAIRSSLSTRGWEINVAELSYLPTNFTDVNGEQQKDISKLLETLEDYDDSHRIYVSLKA